MTAEPLAFPFLLFGVVIAVVVAVVIIGAIQAKRRREAFAALARELGLGYTARDNTIASTYSFLDKLRQGSNRYAYNVIEGEYKGHFVRVFDFHFETHSTDSKGRKQTHHHNFSFFMLYQERPWPELRIYPENILSRFGQMLGFDDIDFESVEFSKAFTVRSTDKRFAYDICHAKMMEYLLAHRDLSIEVEDQCVAMSFDRCLDVNEIPLRLDQLIEIRELFPRYLYET